MDIKALSDTVAKRRSHRKYYNDILSGEEQHAIEAAISELKPLYPDIKCKIELVFKSHVRTMMPWMPPYAIVAFSEVRDGYLENIGFMLDELDLFIQSCGLGLGSCWVGMGKPREGMLDSEGMEYVMMLAVGKTKEKMRKGEADFKRNSLCEISDTEDARLASARLAPSSINSQPWYFEHAEGAIRLYQKRLVRTKNLTRMNRIDVGIALAHLYVSNPESFSYFIETPTPVLDKMDYILTFKI